MKITIIKQIHACFGALSSGDKYVHRTVDIPISPFPGLFILDKDFEAEITDITIDLSTGQIRCYTPADETLYDVHNPLQMEEKRAEEIQQEYIKDGWEKGRNRKED